MKQETTWKELIEELKAQALLNNTGYLIYGYRGKVGFLNDEELTKKEGHPGVLLASILAPVTIPELGEQPQAFLQWPEWIDRGKNAIETIDDDARVLLIGAPVGNKNSAHGRHKRRVLSLSGPEFDLMMDRITEGNQEPSNAEVLEAVYAALKQVYG